MVLLPISMVRHDHCIRTVGIQNAINSDDIYYCAQWMIDESRAMLHQCPFGETIEDLAFSARHLADLLVGLVWRLGNFLGRIT